MIMLEVYVDGKSVTGSSPLSRKLLPVEIFDDLDYAISHIKHTYGAPFVDGAALIINKVEDDMNMTYTCYLNEIFPTEFTEQELEELVWSV